MRRRLDRERLNRFFEELGRRSSSPGVVYVTGGATALLLGIREQTIDLDLKLDPEPRGAFDAIAHLKEGLGLNVELASPDQFVPALAGWRDRSPLIATVGPVQFRHFDLYTQALAKIERGYDPDLSDARAFVTLGLVDVGELQRLYAAVRPQLVRFPAVDSAVLDRKIEE